MQPDRRADLGRRSCARSREDAARSGIWLVVDLCYEKLIYDPVPHNLPAVLGRALPGAGGDLRLGVEGVRDDRLALRLADRAGGGDRRVERDAEPLDLERHVDHAEGGGRGADGSQAPVTAMLDEYRTRRDQLHAWLTADPRLRCRKPAGAFYMFLDISDALSPDGFRTSLEWAEALLEEQRVAVTPGEAFDAPGLDPHVVRDVDGDCCKRGQRAAARVRRASTRRS